MAAFYDIALLHERVHDAHRYTGGMATRWRGGCLLHFSGEENYGGYLRYIERDNREAQASVAAYVLAISAELSKRRLSRDYILPHRYGRRWPYRAACAVCSEKTRA